MSDLEKLGTNPLKDKSMNTKIVGYAMLIAPVAAGVIAFAPEDVASKFLGFGLGLVAYAWLYLAAVLIRG